MSLQRLRQIATWSLRHFASGVDCSPSSTPFKWTSARKPRGSILLTFQIAELENANLHAGEDEELETARRVLANADRLQRLCGEAYAALYDSDDAALGSLGTVWKTGRGVGRRRSRLSGSRRRARRASSHSSRIWR